MFRLISLASAVGGVVVTIAALGSPEQERIEMFVGGSGLFAGSAVAALLADAGVRRKFKPIVDVEKETRYRQSLAQKGLEDVQKKIEHQRKLAQEELDKIDQAKVAANNKVRLADEHLDLLQHEVADMKNQKKELKDENAGLRQRINDLNQDVEDLLDLDDAGFAARRYPGLDSKRLADLLKQNREKQKALGKQLLQECKLTEVTVGGSRTQGAAFVRQTVTALLRGFNGECDAAISMLKHSNDSTVLGKIERAFKFYEKQARTRVEMPWDSRLSELKVDEAYLVHENALTKQAEREEQIELRRQEREEEQARREAEEAKEAAEREAENYEQLLARAREEAAANDQSEEYLEKIRELERRVQEAEDNRERAISRAQMTRSGHVYVISNIGSFGHNVFKVGMTRRLEPTDRVRELGDASVPFPFDIHAMIFTEDAPGLENAIHNRISARRLNLVNLRREFFTITWEELVREAEAAAEEIGVTAEIRWTRIAEAEQYRQSVSERADTNQPLRFLEQKRLQKVDANAFASSSTGVG